MSDADDGPDYPASEILDTIEKDGPQTVKEAAGAIFTVDQTFSALKTLEDEGYVESARNPERFGTTEKKYYIPEQEQENDVEPVTTRGVYLMADTPLTAHPLVLEDGSGDKGLLAECLVEQLDEEEIDQLISDLTTLRQ